MGHFPSECSVKTFCWFSNHILVLDAQKGVSMTPISCEHLKVCMPPYLWGLLEDGIFTYPKLGDTTGTGVAVKDSQSQHWVRLP